MTAGNDYCMVKGTDMSDLRNRNEKRVIECMREQLDGRESQFSDDDLRQVYVWALDQLPARYTQKGTIVLRDPIRKESIQQAVKQAFERLS